MQWPIDDPMSAPTYNYPVNFAIRNTFIEIGPQHMCLQDALGARHRSRSCPGSPSNGLTASGASLSPAEPEAPAVAVGVAVGQHSISIGEVERQADTHEVKDTGSLVIPSVGSAGHYTGRCKPCAFVHTEKSCLMATDCKFCHLCAPGEKKAAAGKSGTGQDSDVNGNSTSSVGAHDTF
eukprot:CAMPEP_0179132908 /NCGR_PEP_ID=MMETSP0796-20121207/63185_1 /TAXON_ID=73915 /ORGANISM="Pyrodinium bahamense, Strain pbaha01" /LENGTH=178 /DNA_ID=CAMNT_0020831859 /DNA_START=72 /DNA_END=609 /DNA_ORIENTATION=+